MVPKSAGGLLRKTGTADNMRAEKQIRMMAFRRVRICKLPRIQNGIAINAKSVRMFMMSK
jgi:hypothetical protein